MCQSVPTTEIWPNWILTYFIKISKNFKTQHGSPQESLHMIEFICPYNSMWVCHCDLCVSENVAIWPFQIFYWLLIEKINGLKCLSVPTTDIWPNWILTYFIKISKNFKTKHGSPKESMLMFELICPYNSMWVCHCDWCVSDKCGHLAFSNILLIINWKKLTDWCVLVCQRLTYGQIEFWHILLKFRRKFQNKTWVPKGVYAYVWAYLSLQLYVSVSLWLVCLW